MIIGPRLRGASPKASFLMEKLHPRSLEGWPIAKTAWAGLQALRKQLQSLRREISIPCPVNGPHNAPRSGTYSRRNEAE
jgi:hypothetical protein